MYTRHPNLFESRKEASIQSKSDDDEVALEGHQEPDFDGNGCVFGLGMIKSSSAALSKSTTSPAA